MTLGCELIVNLKGLDDPDTALIRNLKAARKLGMETIRKRLRADVLTGSLIFPPFVMRQKFGCRCSHWWHARRCQRARKEAWYRSHRRAFWTCVQVVMNISAQAAVADDVMLTPVDCMFMITQSSWTSHYPGCVWDIYLFINVRLVHPTPFRHHTVSEAIRMAYLKQASCPRSRFPTKNRIFFSVLETFFGELKPVGRKGVSNRIRSN
jgi:hypothetical protein